MELTRNISSLCAFQGLLQPRPNSTVEDSVTVMARERLSDRVLHYNVRRTRDLAAGIAVPDSVSVFAQKQARSNFTGYCTAHNYA